MARYRLVAALVPIALGSCSQMTELSARFIAGRVAFVSMTGSTVDCVQSLSVVDTLSRETMWQIGDVGTGACQAALPIRYGQAVAAASQPAKPLRFGRRYEIDGGASGGNMLTGRFDLRPARALRLTDLEFDPTIDDIMRNDIENQLQ